MRAEIAELRRKLVGAETELVKARADLDASRADLATARETASGTTAHQDQLIAERAALLTKNEQARSRVEAMILRLKSLEHNA